MLGYHHNLFYLRHCPLYPLLNTYCCSERLLLKDSL
jgi:hypothetical protein